MKGLLKPLLLALWFFLGYVYWQQSKECCASTASTTNHSQNTHTKPASQKVTKPAVALSTEAKSDPKVDKSKHPLLFDWSKSQAQISDLWPNRKKELLAEMSKDHIMEITGLYKGSERNPTSFKNLGLARAHQVRKLFPELSDAKLRLLGKQIESNGSEAAYAAVKFAKRIETKNISESENGTRIHFPYNSTNKLNDKSIEKYLNRIATQVKKSGARILLTGHTDNIGEEAPNRRLGMWRAEVIRNYLLNQGVAAKKITVRTMGETQPIATNDTPEGRALNRRTELQIIK